MSNNIPFSLNSLPLEAMALMANITLNKHEIDQLKKENCKEIDPCFVLNLKNEFIRDYHKGDGQIANNPVAVDILVYYCVAKSYSRGYETALKQYSSIVKRAIAKAAKRKCTKMNKNAIKKRSQYRQK